MKFLAIITLLTVSVTAGFGETFVYISESKDQTIGIFFLDESEGTLKRIGDLKCSGAMGCLSPSADQSKIYASVRGASEFATIAVDPKTGMLSHIASAPAAGGASYIFPDKTEKWLLAAYYREGLATVSKIENGVVTGSPIQTFETGKKAHCIQTSPDNRFAFVPHPVDLNKVHQFKFDAATGKLENNDPEKMDGAEGAGPRHMQFHPNHPWAYVVNEQGKSVTHCLYDIENGTLTRQKTTSTIPSDWQEVKGSCADIEITEDGKFLYASNRGHDSIAMLEIDQTTGELSSLGQAPTAMTPRSFNLIPGGKFLVAAGQRDNTLVVYSRDAETGLLSELKRYPSGKSPAWVLGIKFD